MALQKIPVAVKFSGGVNTKPDPKQVPAAQLLTLENGVFTKAISIVKRNGYADLPRSIDGSTATISGAKRLAARDDELLALTGSEAYSLRGNDTNWSDTGAVYSVVGSDAPAVRTGTQQTISDHATLSGIRVYAWEDSKGGVWWSVVDSSTGRVCRAPEQLDSGGQRPRCVTVGSVLHVYWVNTTAQVIKVAICNPSAPGAAVTPATLVSDLSATNPVYDAEATTYAGTPAIMAWAENGTTNVRIGFVDASGILGGPATSLPLVYREAADLSSTSPISITSWRGGNAAKIALTVQTSTSVSTFYYELVTSGGLTNLSRVSLTGWDASGLDVKQIVSTMLDTKDTSGEQQIWVVNETKDASFTDNSQRTIRASLVSPGPATSSTISVLFSVGLAARAFWVDGEGFVPVVHDTTYFNTYLVMRLSDWICVARVLPGLADGLVGKTHLPSCQYNSATDISMCLPYKERLISENNDKFTETGLRYIDLDFDSSSSHQYAQLGRGLYVAGACPQHYDGHGWDELGFHVGPELIVATPAAGGSLTSSVEYEYYVWYEWTDGQGEIHRGPTSVATVVTMGGSDTQVTLTLPMLRVTKKTNVRIGVARSKGNDSSAFYRVTSLDPSVAGANGYILNDPTAQTATFIDRMSDATLITQEPLYTNGGILSNDPTALGPAVARSKTRLFFTDPSNPNLIHYSQPLDQGYGVEIPPDLQILCDPYGGDIVALADMDGQIIVFKQHALYVFGGDGPLANGDSSSSGFDNPQLITSDVGCTEPASIVLTPVGLMFKSAKGIYLLDRSKTVSYVGAPVEAYNSQSVRRATLMQDRTQVVFLTDSGLTLLYDYLFQQWSTFTNHEGYDAAIVGGTYHYVRTDGRVFKETPGVYSDGGQPIKLRLETAWIKLHPYLQGWSRFYHLLLIGQWDSAHQLVMQVQTDYTNSWSAPAFLDATNSTSATGWITGTGAGTIGAEPIGGTSYGDGPYGDGVYGGTPASVYQWRMHLGLVGQAIRFRFEDYQMAGSPGASFELSEMLLTGGVKGIAKKPFSAGRST